MAKHSVLIRHGAFNYFAPENVVRDGKETEILVERTAFHNERVDLTLDTDYERGLQYGCFWTQDEAEAHYDAMGIPAPLLSASPNMRQPEPLAAGGEGESGAESEIELTELDEDELVDWLMSTGRFDGNKKPTVGEVVEAGKDGGEQFSEKLHKAEVRASGDAPRQGIVDGLGVSPS